MLQLKYEGESVYLEKDAGSIPIREAKEVIESLGESISMREIMVFLKCEAPLKINLTLHNKNQMKITVSENAMEATLEYKSLPSYEQVLSELHSQGIIFGILEAEIQEFLQEKKPSGKMIVARGIPPQKGKEGYVEWKVDLPNQKALQKEDGTVDYYQLDIFRFVKKGDTIAIVHPPEPGMPGKDVLGKIVPPGKTAVATPKIKSGAERREHLIVAKTDGLLVMESGFLRIEPLLVIPSDVDYKTGNIDSNIDVQINGWVRSGFSVKSEKSVCIVRGVEEKCKVDAKRDISIQLGVAGNGTTSIISGGTIKAKFIQDAFIQCEQDLMVNEYILNSEVICGGNVYVNGKKGSIMQSSISAGMSIVAKRIANSRNTIIQVKGFDRKSLLEEIRDCNKHILSIKEKIKVLVFKIRNIKQATQETVLALVQEYENHEITLKEYEETLSALKAIIKNVDGEGMIKSMGQSNELNVSIKGEAIRVLDDQPAKLYYDPDQKKVIKEWLTRLG